MSKRILQLAAILLVLNVPGCSSETGWVAFTPAGNAYTHINRSGTTVLPNGRLITPLGRQIETAPHPYGLTLSNDGSIAVTANSGVQPFSITVIRDVMQSVPDVQQIPPGAETDEGILAAVFMGLAVSPDNQTIYVGGGQEGSIILFNVSTGDRTGHINCNVTFGDFTYEDSYIGDLVLSKDGSLLYAVDQTNFRMIVVNTEARRLVASVPIGRYPFGITLTPDEQDVFIANVGLYSYSLVGGVAEGDPERQGLSFPPFAYQSKESIEGVEVEGYQVPGLGEANVPESFSVWTVDVSDPARPAVTKKIKTGILIGEMVDDFPAVGGSSPNSLVATDQYVFVSNGNNDSISIIETRADSVVAEVDLLLDERLGILRGAIPFGMALSPDERRLYVAEAGINAVAVIDIDRREVLGHIPTAWFPSKVAVSPDGRSLFVANAKGYGSGPNGGPTFERGPEGSYVGNLMKGTLSVITIPDDADLVGTTEQVVRNNFDFRHSNDPTLTWRATNPVPIYPGERESPIKHLVFVTKENRTYDEVFGQVEEGVGEPSLARYGYGARFSNDSGETLENITVAPNHLALAQQFGIADNFYCDSDVSADGHRWLVGVYPNEWVETCVAASYGGGRNMKLSSAPGVLSFVGSSGAVYPEDYNEAGTIWDHFDRHHIDFFNFGLGFQFAGGIEIQDYKYTGIRLPINYPMPAPLFERTSRKYATYNMSIPDQFRLDMFIEEFEVRWMGNDTTMPAILTVFLPNDHGAAERPADGYPFRESYMADNDLALGRLVEYLSHTPYWEHMAIIVTEDDPQGGVDHIDAHRSILMVISPYAKRGYISGVHYSFGSIMKTFWHVLGIPYLNQYDAGATDLADFFVEDPDPTPYQAVAPDLRLFDPQRALDPLDEDFDWEAIDESPILDDVATIQAWRKAEEGESQ